MNHPVFRGLELPACTAAIVAFATGCTAPSSTGMASASAPTWRVDATWPKPLPNP